ncbi:MAG: glycerol-3-phosphate dehydrogenase [Bacteroidia bacterium]
MSSFNSLDRATVWDHMCQTPYDLLVIGGGITGAGIALDAASRGLRTCLVERQDFAAGTSSRSTKLIHGGLRYLKQLEVKLVAEVGRERATLHRLARHLVVAEKMLLPLVRGGTYGKAATSFGLWVYDVLAQVKGDDQRRMLSREATLAQEPLLRPEGLLGGGLYAEYRTDDARLTIEVLKTAARYQADCLNYAQVTDFVYENGQLVGAQVRDLLGEATATLRARQIVSAAGPWVDELRQADRSLKGKRLHLTKGVHIVVPHERLPLRQPAYFDVPDGRMIFAIPRGRTTYIGTTDTDYSGSKEHPLTSREDVAYLLEATNNLFPTAQLVWADVESSWAGLRPLIHEDGKSASELSRKDEIFISPSGLISIAGGKLTGYRKMAQRVVQVVARRLRATTGQAVAPGSTRRIVLNGGEFTSQQDLDAFAARIAAALQARDLTHPYYAWYLVHTYGRQAQQIVEAMSGNNEAALVLAECAFACKHEMVQRLVDFFVRRTGRLYFDIGSVHRHRMAVTAYMARHLGWSPDRTATETALLDQALHEAAHFDPQLVAATHH